MKPAGIHTDKAPFLPTWLSTLMQIILAASAILAVILWAGGIYGWLQWRKSIEQVSL